MAAKNQIRIITFTSETPEIMAKEEKYTQSIDELREHLLDQIEFLKSSADAFDKGDEREAKRLAASIRVIAHNTPGKSKSLLSQLNLESGEFFDSAFEQNPANKLSHSGLLVKLISKSSGAQYQAFLDDVPHGKIRKVAFPVWWESLIFVDAEAGEFSRKDLVLKVANQDGGAHVDPEIDQSYAKLSRGNSLQDFYYEENELRPMEGAHRAAIRQIAHELLKSISPGYQKMPTYPPDSFATGGSMLITHGSAGDEASKGISKKTKLGRNARCLCGSGFKYKKCCGKNS